MNGVSSQALAMILDAAGARGCSPEELMEGLDLPPRDRLGLFGRIEWDPFATVCDRLGERLGGADAAAQFGEALTPSASLSVLRVLGRVLYDPRDLIRIGGKWFGPTVLPMIEAHIEELPDGLFIERLVLQDGHRHCPTVFHILRGILVASPLQWGNPRSEVEMQLDLRGATYFIRPHMARLGWLSRAIRRFRGRTSVKNLVSELEVQSVDINASYREVRGARDRIAAQAAELAQVNAIGRELSRHIELDQVGDVLMRVLVENLLFAGAAIELDLPSKLPVEAPRVPAYAAGAGLPEQSESTPRNEPERDPGPGQKSQGRLTRMGGSTSGEPFRTYTLEAATGPMGSLSVWNPPVDAGMVRPDPARDSVLERLLPWISIALENARTYRQLESHAADLQSRVLERTARLLTTNHHLVREIEERKQATEALLISEAQLRASERLASIGTLAAGIAHEINNPIGSILAAAQLALLVQHEEGADVQITDSLSDIVSEAKRCGEIVRSVLQFSRDERTEKWDCHLQHIVRRATRLTDPYIAEFGAQLQSNLPDPAIWVHVNPIQIEQALVNLIRNAIEAGGHDIQLSVNALPSEGIACIEVRDDGSGIPDADQVRVFEPFYTTKRSDGGTGLGLSVVHGIVMEHGGTLKAGTRPTGRTCMMIELPMVTAPPKNPDDSAEPRR